MNSNWHVLANWKMYFTYTQSVRWISDHIEELEKLSNRLHLGIAPEATTLPSLHTLVQNSNIMLGGQTCSKYVKGAYTGEISPQSLYNIGVTFCLVGHSERRAYHNETSEDVAEKVYQLLEHTVTPVICVGEREQEHNNNETKRVIQEQLYPVKNTVSQGHIYIAYEPRWAIGSGETPSNEAIAQAIDSIREYLHDTNLSLTVLYGGSVNETSLPQLKNISSLDGFLIGSASCDFQELKKIIYSLVEA